MEDGIVLGDGVKTTTSYSCDVRGNLTAVAQGSQGVFEYTSLRGLLTLAYGYGSTTTNNGNVSQTITRSGGTPGLKLTTTTMPTV